MEKSHTNPYAALDQPQVLQFLFHPRRDTSEKAVSEKEHFIPVDQDIEVGAAFSPRRSVISQHPFLSRQWRDRIRL
jgi:hypothetical protein